MTTYSGFVHLNGNLLSSVDVETTGKTPGYHEIIQIGIQPLDSDLKPLEDVSPFVANIKPEHVDRADPKATSVHKIDLEHLCLHAPDKWMVADWLDDWWNKLGLPFRKTLAPLAQNWQFEAGFLKAWLGVESFHQFFHPFARDTMLMSILINDLHYRRGLELPFISTKLKYLCRYFGIENTNPHNALADARAEAEVYKAQLEMLNAMML